MILLPFFWFVCFVFSLSFYLFDLIFAVNLTLAVLFLLLLFGILAVKIFLAQLKATELKWYDPLNSRIGQWAKRLDTPVPYLYESQLFHSSFFCFQSLRNQNYFLIGKKMREVLTPEEIDALFVLALVRLKSEKKSTRFSSAFLLSLLTFPRRLIAPQLLEDFWNFFYFPLEELMKYLFISKEAIEKCDKIATEHLGQKASLASAIYKLSAEDKRWRKKHTAFFILPYFALAMAPRTSLFGSILGDYQFSRERYKILVTPLERKQDEVS